MPGLTISILRRCGCGWIDIRFIRERATLASNDARLSGTWPRSRRDSLQNEQNQAPSPTLKQFNTFLLFFQFNLFKTPLLLRRIITESKRPFASDNRKCAHCERDAKCWKRTDGQPIGLIHRRMMATALLIVAPLSSRLFNINIGGRDVATPRGFSTFSRSFRAALHPRSDAVSQPSPWIPGLAQRTASIWSGNLF